MKRWPTLDYFGPVQAYLVKEAALHLANHIGATGPGALSSLRTFPETADHDNIGSYATDIACWLATHLAKSAMAPSYPRLLQNSQMVLDAANML